jgi:CPA2 family monovalent cation:H+ antiporter-2
VVLANSEYRHELESDIEPFKGLLLGLFFIAVGASIDFALIGLRPGLIAGLVGALITIKFAVLVVLGRVFKMGTDQTSLFAFSLAQGGEFAFVLFSFATQNGVLTPAVVSPLVAAVALSMALTPLLMMVNDKLIQPRFGTKERDIRRPDAIAEESPVIIAGFGRFGNIVGRLLRANGVDATVLDLDSDHVDVLRRLGLKVFYGDASRHELLRSAGGEQAQLIVLAVDEHDKTLELVHTVRKHFPNLRILARAAGRTEAYELLDLGVEHVYRETLDSSLRLGIDALQLLGVRANQAHRSAKTFRRHDEKALRDLAHHRHDRKEYLRRAKQRIADLEDVLTNEQERALSTDDAAWDPDSLREDIRKNFAAD